MTVKSFNLVKKAPKLGVRHLQVLFLFSCGSLAFHQRMNLSVGIVAMTNANSSNPDYEEYNLTEQQKSYVLSSNFWGSACSQLLAGYLSSRYGSKLLLLLISLGSALMSLCIPPALAIGGWRLLCLVRLLQGLCMGAMWPCFYTHLAKWCPKEERNRLGGITQSGMDIGTALGFALSGILAASPLGWPSMFYVPGCCGLIWCLFWLRYGANSPADSPFISLAERKRIELSQGQSSSMESVPWRAILSSPPYLSLAFCKMSQACSFFTLMQQLPSYIHGVFHYSIQLNALISALPFLVMCAMSYVFVFAADYLTRRRKVPLSILRKSINSLASWLPAIALVTLSYLSERNVAGSIACLIVAVAAISGQAIGSSLNHIDLSPNYAGLLFGISNTLMSFAGVVSPIIVGLTVSNQNDRSQWRSVFLGIAVILFLGNLLYLIFGQMTVQPWNGTQQQQPLEVIKSPPETAAVEKFKYSQENSNLSRSQKVGNQIC